MLTKTEFADYITEYLKFEEGVDKLSNLLGNIPLYESNLYGNVGKMLDLFLDSHFTEEGVDWVCYYLWENVDDKYVKITKPKDIFNEEEEIEYHLNTLDDLWNFLLTDKERYFKNV